MSKFTILLNKPPHKTRLETISKIRDVKVKRYKNMKFFFIANDRAMYREPIQEDLGLEKGKRKFCCPDWKSIKWLLEDQPYWINMKLNAVVGDMSMDEFLESRKAEIMKECAKNNFMF